MADFVAVIRRAVDGLSNNTPEMRVKVYEKARGAVMRQLENMTPKPSEEMLRRQLDKLEGAIVEVEAEYAEALPAVEENVDVEPAYEPEEASVPEADPEPHAAEPEPYHSAEAEETHFVPEPEAVATAYQPQDHHTVYEPEQPVYHQEPEPWQAPEYRAPEQHVHDHHEPEHDEQDDRTLHSAHEQPTWPEREAEPVPVAPPARHAIDSWLDGHLEETAAAKPLPQNDWRSPVSEPKVERSRQEMPQIHPIDESGPLGAFDAFVRNTGVNNAATTPPQPISALGGDSVEDPAWFDDFVTTNKTPVPVDGSLKTLTSDTGKRQGVSKDEMSAVLKKGKKKASGTRKTASRGVMRYILGGVLVVVLAGGGYAAYVKRDFLTSLVKGMTPPAPQTASQPAKTDGTESAGVKAATSGGDAQAGAAGQKFTQQLLPDGTEVDRGASDAAANGNEGRSVAQQNVAANAGAPAAAASAPPAKAFTVPANGQKAYLYEERLGETTPATMQGYVVWEEKSEADDSGKNQPVVQGKLTIPDQGLTALITFKRNTDASLPASHLAEIVFSVPKTFPGGGIDSVQRIAMKQTEQDRGDPIVAVPAKIIDDSFMIAFNDFTDVVARNVALLKDREWMDIPVTYRNGRRALITLDKGTVGKQIFDNVIKEWAALGPAKNGG
ncbi:hypothetical protein [Rhizobium sp.]|jgi:hypothetical protein|uniref:hypothetical protein n=1 Tax=Rhizobium sp. TaxID=391 RepID=UPI000E89E5BC|nr:hypothetical protein [Rhizobium sp.]